MATNFPTSLDSYTNPTSTTLRTATGGISPSATITDMQDALEALQAKVGVDSSAVATSHDYKLANLATADITDITSTAAELNITKGGDTTEKVLNTQCKVYAYLSADQDNIPNDSFVRVEFDAEAFDVGGDMSGARFTAPVTGYYVVSGNVEFEAGTVADGKTIGVLIYVNGSQYQKCRSLVTIGATNSSSASITSIVYMTASQYLDLYCYHNHGDGSPDVESTGTFLSIHLLSV